MQICDIEWSLLINNLDRTGCVQMMKDFIVRNRYISEIQLNDWETSQVYKSHYFYAKIGYIEVRAILVYMN